MKRQINLVIIDDHDIIRDGLRHALSAYPEFNVIASVGVAEDAVSAVKTNHVDIVLTDVYMPGTGPLGMTDKIKRASQNDKISFIVITAYSNSMVLQRLTEKSVMGCVLKSSGSDELIKAIKEVYEGKYYIDLAVMNSIALSKLSMEEKSLLSKLTDKELMIVILTMQNFTSQEIAQKMCLSKKTINARRYSILAKLKKPNFVSVFNSALAEGFFPEIYTMKEAEE